MATAEKEAAVAELVERFCNSDAAVLTEYRGLTVEQLRTLRRSLGENTHYAVVKNTLADIAAKEAGVDAFEGLLNGPTAIAFIEGEPVEAAKAMRDFAKDNEALVIKGGYMEGAALDVEGVKKLADLESREVLLSKLAGAMKGGMSKAAALFQSPLSKAVRTTEALRAKQEDAA
ncbi:50S ribosomal protein L10 [Auritidibacter ignavus]|uniref:50S ribosomal protein L10 n=1 Tax=Auritidibacter ignavus TaxID=678932 RepID=UPI00244D28F1|nr:50S ribosomal protein L10 [Auritidibacter ignavus]WGH83790.1 50S ribosomal protein L10 [Auritidibacter ignavus]